MLILNQVLPILADLPAGRSRELAQQMEESGSAKLAAAVPGDITALDGIREIGNRLTREVSAPAVAAG